jgi:hypothetical protein
MLSGDFGKWARETGSIWRIKSSNPTFSRIMVIFSLLYHINNSIHLLSHFISSRRQSHEKHRRELNLLSLDSHYNPSLQPNSPTLRLSLTSASAPTIPDNTFVRKCTASDERGVPRHKN